MENQTRELFDKYIVRQAHLNGVTFCRCEPL